MKRVLCSFGFFLAFAGLSEASPRVQTEIVTDLKSDSFQASVKEGFHFNEKAPNSLDLDGQIIKPKALAGRNIEFAALPAKFKSGRAYLYVCDDALTFCEPRTVELKGGKTSPPAVGKAVKPGRINGQGFIEEDFAGALDKAKTEKKLVLVDFSARWCPGCMRFENETFGAAFFKAITKDFVKVKLDVDRFENSVLKEKYKIWGIPTLLVLNSEQQEIVRLYDYQPQATLETFFSDIKKDPSTLLQLDGKAKAGDKQAALTLGKRLALAGKNVEAIEYLAKVKPAPAELAMAELNLAQENYNQDPSKKGDFAKAIKKAIQSEPNSSRSIEWREMLVGVLNDKAEIQATASEGSVLADRLLQDPVALNEAMKTDLIGEFTGFEPLKVALNRADLLASAEVAPEVQKQAWVTAAKVGNELKITSANAGLAVRYLSILLKAEQFKEADTLSQLMLKRDSRNPEMQYRRLKVLMATKKYGEAIDLGNLCLQGSYGRNEFMIAENLAKAYVAEKRTKEAKVLLDKYLARTDLNWPSMQASRKNLEDLRRAL